MCTDPGMTNIDTMIRQHSLVQRPFSYAQCKEKLSEYFKSILNKIFEPGTDDSQEDQRGKQLNSPFASEPIAEVFTSLLKDRAISVRFFIEDEKYTIKDFLSRLNKEWIRDKKDYWRARCVLQPIRHSATYNPDLILLLFELKEDVLKDLLNLAYHDCAVDVLRYLVRMLPPGGRQVAFANVCKNVLDETFEDLKNYREVDDERDPESKKKAKALVRLVARIGGIVELLTELNQKWFPGSEYFTGDDVGNLLDHVFRVPPKDTSKFAVDEILSAQRRLAFFVLHYVTLCILSCLFLDEKRNDGFYFNVFLTKLTDAMPKDEGQLEDDKVLRHFLQILCRCLCILSDIRQAVVKERFASPAEFGYNYVAHRDDNTGVTEWASLGPTAYVGIGGIADEVSIYGWEGDDAWKMKASRESFLLALGNYVDGLLSIPTVGVMVKKAKGRIERFSREVAPNAFDYMLQFCLTRIQTIVGDLCFTFASRDSERTGGELTAKARELMKKLFGLTDFEDDCKAYLDLVTKTQMEPGNGRAVQFSKNPRMVYVKCVAQKLGEFRKQEPEIKCVIRRFKMFGDACLSSDNWRSESTDKVTPKEIVSLDEAIPRSVHEAICKACSGPPK
ncbi:hypothetical protein GMRT_11709 [Giardia muris]|uniref:Uncharacterized protein n=1 Tax=Giardia muris TaxID=5742 RepID=A0A4Z1SSU7_GIAMU|nr:hypothetical protein GMRT_11709 [Giardia muris]|eukprot:TNJ26718.1 hypothetical protein GMRT_11709 [Giardia muris]